MNRQPPPIYHLNGVEIDPLRVCVTREGQEQHLRQKTFQVLIYLLENRQRLVSKNELIETIWADTAVTDNTLEQCLAEIRKVLGDNSRQPRFIKTVPRAGYRFIGEVEEIRAGRIVQPEPPSPLAPEPATASGAMETSRSVSRPIAIGVAVLLLVLAGLGIWYLVRQRASRQSLVSTTLPQDPTRRPVAVMFFDNESGSADLDWLREGLADMIITDLSRSNSLAVLSRQQLHVLLNRIGHQPNEKISLDDALNVARQTQAKLLVLGRFAKLGDQIRIDVHLHDARDGQLLTAERLVVDQPGQIFTQVDLLSLKLAQYLGATPPPAINRGAGVMTNNLEAFRNYSLGVEKAGQLRNEEALVYLRKAIDLDPDFAMAHARIGYVYGVTGNSLDEAKPFLQKAFQFSDGLTEKDKLQITAWYAIVNFDYGAAIDAFRRIIAADPLETEAYRRLGQLLRGEGRVYESIDVLKQGLLIDAGAKDLYNSLGAAYSELGRHDEATAMFQRYVQLAPDEPNAHDSLGLGYEWAGRYDEAIQEYQRALQLKPDFEIAIVHLANAYFRMGRYRAAIDEYRRYVLAAHTDAERVRGYDCIGYVELRRGQLESAEKANRQTLNYIRINLWLSYLFALKNGDFPKAAKLNEEMEKRQANERGLRASLRPLYHRRGTLALKLGKAAEAIENFKLVLGHRPLSWNIDAWEDCLANAYLELGRLDEAITEYQRILKLNPNYPLVHFHLAQAYERQGKVEQAQANYVRFLEVWKDADGDIPEVMSARKALGR